MKNKMSGDEEYTSSPNGTCQPGFPSDPTPGRVSGRVTTNIDLNANPFFNYGERVVLQRGQGLPLFTCSEVIKTPTGLRAIATRRRDVPDEGSRVGGRLIPSAESTCNEKDEVSQEKDTHPPKEQS